MKAQLLCRTGSMRSGSGPLVLDERDLPVPAENEVLLRVTACGVCHTELDEIEGRTPPPRLPVIPGHQVIGRVQRCGSAVHDVRPGERRGVAWIYSACGSCRYCLAGQENLCPAFQATGRDTDGGYAEYMAVPAAFTHPIPDCFTDTEAAPLLCAGAVGYRSLRLTAMANGDLLALAGFGASGHLVLSMARHLYPDSPIFVFARNPAEREFARSLGAVWAGDFSETAPQQIDAVIDTTPAWRPVLTALQNLRPGGRLVINAIRKEAGDRDQLLGLDYGRHLWMEKEIKSVANVCRSDVREFLQLAAEMHLRPRVQTFPLEEANRALQELKAGIIRGAKVLLVG